MGKTATMMVVCTAEVAQSYMVHARSIGRPRPTRDQKIDDGMAGKL
jgi:hypothetical protein